MTTRTKTNAPAAKPAALTETEALAALDATVRDGGDAVAAFLTYRRAVTRASARRNHQANESVRRHNEHTEPVRQLFSKANNLAARYGDGKPQTNPAVGTVGQAMTRRDLEQIRTEWLAVHRDIAEAVGEPMVPIDDPDVQPAYVRLHGAYERRNPLVSATTLRSGMPLGEALERSLQNAESAWASAAIAEQG